MSPDFLEYLRKAIGSIMIGVGARLLVSEKWRENAPGLIATGVYILINI